jgi:hypothetical protein
MNTASNVFGGSYSLMTESILWQDYTGNTGVYIRLMDAC